MNKILIIEDESETRDMFLEALREEGFEVIGAENGRIGIQKTQEYLPDVVICDVAMPELNGNQVLITLRQNSTTATIPFIFLTAITDESQRYQAIQLGANDYLTKPCTIEKLLEAIAKLSNHS
ncbi:MAG: response regulator transcription factor [Waterburya sp.]